MEVVPSPKFQSQEVGDPVLVSVNATVNGEFPEMGEAENAATGDEAVPTFIVSVSVSVFPPDTVSVTVYIPTEE